jgi:predicted nucleic acid-binding protein
MCKPNKSLRMTVRAFIKAEEKKKAAAAEAAAAAAVEQEEAAAQQSEQITEQAQEESEIQAEPVAEQLQDENVDVPDATEGALAPEATDPLAQVEEVRPWHITLSG